MAKNDREVTIEAGQLMSQFIPIPRDRIGVPPGQLKGAEGGKVKGKDAPTFSVVSVDAGNSQIVLDEAHDEDLVFTVKDKDDKGTAEGGQPDQPT